MIRKINIAIISLIFIISLGSSLWGWQVYPNFKDPNNPGPQRDYTRENATKPVDKGGYKGGHDTIIGEAMLLKKDIHEQTDADGGTDFNNKMVQKALPSLRTGAHDEDATKWGVFGYPDGEKPIGPNGDGDYTKHFYNPETGKGWFGSDSAVQRAKDYANEIKKKLGCKELCALPEQDPKNIFDYIGRIGHLIADMAVPEHHSNNFHGLARGGWAESHTLKNWDKVINSQVFKDKVDKNVYNNENNKYNKVDLDNPKEAMDNLTNITPDIYTHYDFLVPYCDGTLCGYKFSEELLNKAIASLVSEATLYTAGLIDSAYDKLSKCTGGSSVCKLPPVPVGPGGDHPDDRFDVSDGFYWEQEFKISDYDLTNLYLRTALKKGKIGVWYKKLFMDKFADGMSKLDTATEEEINLLNSGLKALWDKLEQRRPQEDSDWKGSPDIALFANGFYKPSISLMLKYNEPVSFQKADFDPGIVKDHPVMLVPTGGFYGLETSAVARASLDEYVKNGGTLVVFAQQHGIDWGLLPVPQNALTGERKPVEGYGYQQDQNCQYNSVYIDTYHPMLSVFSTATADIGVDGYFTSYPDNSTVLLRRVANGQPAMIMYPYGNGHVIATTLYTDFALSRHQSNQTELNLVQNIISYAKKPGSIVETARGGIAEVNVALSNFMDNNCSSVKFVILDPARKVISEQISGIGIPAKSSTQINVQYQTLATSSLGIYHIDYVLLDANGEIIQPQAETDSGRFAVSNPSPTGVPDKPIYFTVTTTSQDVPFGEPFDYTFHVYNNTAQTRNLKIKTLLPHTHRTKEWNITAESNSITSITGSDIFTDTRYLYETLRATLYDEAGKEIGNYMLSFKGAYPSATISVQTDKLIYAKGETAAIKAMVENKTPKVPSWQAEVKTTVTDPRGTKVFESANTVILPLSGNSTVDIPFVLPSNFKIGTYTVKSEVWSGAKIISSVSSKFELLQSQISVSPNLPTTFSAGVNNIPFVLNNTGRIAVSSGIIDIKLKDPDGADVYTGSIPFALSTGESKTLNFPVNIPPLKFGDYVLTLTQSDETKAGTSTSIIIPNTAVISLSLDKTSYRIRDAANLTINLTNTGKFNLESSTGSGLTIAVVAPDANYNNTITAEVLPGQDKSFQCEFLIPDTVTAGAHNLDARLALPPGSSAGKNITFNVPVSSLTIVYDGPTTLNAGDAINMTIENTGGVDTTYSTVNFSFVDNKGIAIYQGNYTGSILAGEKKTLAEIPVSVQSVNGSAYLNLTIKNNKTDATAHYYKAFEITGLTADLEATTDKAAYLKTETVSGITNIINGQIEIVGGSLTISVTKMKAPSTGQFTHYLPKASGPFYSFPKGVIIGLDGNIYVADSGNNCILKYGNNGNFITKWGSYCEIDTDNDGISDQPCDGQFNHPVDVAVSSDGFVYVTDSGNYRVQKFGSNGNFITKWGSPGSGNGQFSSTFGIAVAPDGSVFVADAYNNRIQKFDSNGNFIRRFGSFGSNSGQFRYPYGIAVAPDGFVYVTDSGNYRVQKFGSNGNFINKWGSYGNRQGQFRDPQDIAVASDGYIYVTDAYVYKTDMQKFDSNGNFITAWGGFKQPFGVTVGSDFSVYIADSGNKQIQRMAPSGGGGFEKIFETTIPVDQEGALSRSYATNIGVLNATGKLYLTATLKNSIGQTVAESEYPFYIVEGNTLLLYSTDKKAYKPGETVTINGEVRNLASIVASGITLTLNSKRAGETALELYNATFDVPANGSIPFTVTTTADTEGVYALTGKVVQNNSVLVEITDQYETANPEVTVAIIAPDVAGNETFNINLELKNEGKVEVSCQVTGAGGQTPIVENQIVTIPAKETKILNYSAIISANTTYNFTITGDINKTLTKIVLYGPGVLIEYKDQTSVTGRIYPEGKTGIPVLITNTGLMDETIQILYRLTETHGTVREISKSYFIPKSGNTADVLYFDLTEGNYSIEANSQYPAAVSQADFEVRKYNKADMSIDIGQQADGSIPISVNLTNTGLNEISGSVELSLKNAQNEIVWSSSVAVSQLLSAPGNSQILTFNINPSAVSFGDYMLELKLIDGSTRLISLSSTPISIKGPVIMISRTPSYETYTIGEEALFAFRVINTGNQEGLFEFNFKAADFVDSTHHELLAPGEEKEVEFGFMLPFDLEDKDYFADYELKYSGGQGSESSKGQVKYHVSGININVAAALNKQQYDVGDTARLTLNVTGAAGGENLNLFARAKYDDYESQQQFTLDGSQVLTFDIPLSQITGEKLFYGIYHESGRSIYLNSLYIYKAGGELRISADKQVYNPGDTINIEITGDASVNGTMVLTAAGYEETFEFSGSASKNFALPPVMTAGTYGISAQLSTSDGRTYAADHPFDVAGISVKVLECNNDRAKYASNDTITTNYVISSNRVMPATLKTWIIDPEGNYTQAGEFGINLLSSENTIITCSSTLFTALSGIHQLVYGIYAGDLLLVSGSETFDVGDAVLLGLSTDKADYPSNNETVTVLLSVFGTADANLEIMLDGTNVVSESVSLNGFKKISYPLANVNPGYHQLKCALLTGGLKSEKETSFVYGSSMADLKPEVRAKTAEIGQENLIEFTATIINQGGISAAASTVAFYDADTLIEIKPVKALSKGESEDVSISWSVMGKAGEHKIKAYADPDNVVAEFKEDNNTASFNLLIPDVSLAATTDKNAYKIRQKANITSKMINLTAAVAYQDLIVVTSVKDPAGMEVYGSSLTVGALLPSESAALSQTWNTAGLQTEGAYTITQIIKSGERILNDDSKTVNLVKASDFKLSVDSDYRKIKQGEKATYVVYIEPLNGWNKSVSIDMTGLPAGTTVTFAPGNLVPPGESLIMTITTAATTTGKNTLNLKALGIDEGEQVEHVLPLVLDVSGFGLIPDHTGLTLKQLETAEFHIDINAINGYEGNVTLSAEDAPFGVKAYIDNTGLIQVPGNVLLTVLTSKYVMPGSYVIKVVGNDGLVKQQAAITINILSNPEIRGGIITSQGPGPKNQAWVRAFNPMLEPILELMAFDTKYGANIISADIDGDGYDEIIASKGPDPKNSATLRAFRRNGTLITEYTAFDTKYGLTLSSGDIDGDWKDDLIVGMGPDPKNPAAIKILEYNGNGFIDTMMSKTVFDTKYGVNIGTGDIDGDGIPEIITAPGPGPHNPAIVKIWKYIENTLTELYSFTAFEGDYGVNIATGDIDGDGIAEIIAGAGPGPQNSATVKIFKGNGTPIGIEFIAYPYGKKDSDDDADKNKGEKEGKYRHGVYVAAGDLDGDGIAEIITGPGSGPQNPSWVKVYKHDGTEITGFLAYPDDTKYGVKVSAGNVGE